jgi:hypothetical protein
MSATILSISGQLETKRCKEEQASFVKCPKCDSVEFAPIVGATPEKEVFIKYLLCLSDECDGDYYFDVNKGVVDKEIKTNVRKK